MSRLPLAKEIMVTNPVTMDPEVKVLPAIRLLLNRRVSGAPVVGRDGRFLGMLSDRICMSAFYRTAKEAGTETSDLPRARELMSKKLFTLSPEADAFEAISKLLKQRFSGAPVVDAGGRFLGVFSERYIMRLVIHQAYEQAPSSRVDAFMNTDRGRVIEETTDLLEIARLFHDSYYRRLPVSKDEKLIGQISPYDILSAEHHVACFVKDHEKTPISQYMDTAADTIEEELDLLAVARVFLDSNRRRLPVLRDGKLVGQISRRGLLLKVLDLMSEQRRYDRPGLFLSAVTDPAQNPILRESSEASESSSEHRSFQPKRSLDKG